MTLDGGVAQQTLDKQLDLADRERAAHLIGTSAAGHRGQMVLTAYQDKLRRLSVNTSHGHPSPHKVCMLLAAFDLVRAGGMESNRIYYSPPLLDRYARYFAAVAGPGDYASPYFPFFHLTGQLRSAKGADREAFWHLTAQAGKEQILAQMRSARSHRDITDVIAFASFDHKLFELLQSPQANDTLSATLVAHWFGREHQDLNDVARQLGQQSDYERSLRVMAGGGLAPSEVPERRLRSAAFRELVLESYDYRCAASGLRILLPDGQAMVEAAHLTPFAETADDDPRNGVALTPDMHWAMDRNLIAPGPDYVWHVSSTLDDRIPDIQHLVRLNNRPMFLPKNPGRYPKREALELRLQRLGRPA